jgi:hypothetical protein
MPPLVLRVRPQPFVPLRGEAWRRRYACKDVCEKLAGVYGASGIVRASEQEVALDPAALAANLPTASMRLVPFPLGDAKAALDAMVKLDPTREARDLLRYNIAPIIVHTPALWLLLAAPPGEPFTPVVPAQYLFFWYNTMLTVIDAHTFEAVVPPIELPTWVTEPDIEAAYDMWVCEQAALRRLLADDKGAARAACEAVSDRAPELTALYESVCATAPVEPADVSREMFVTLREHRAAAAEKQRKHADAVCARRRAIQQKWEAQLTAMFERYDKLFAQQLLHAIDDPATTIEQLTVQTINNVEDMLMAVIGVPVAQRRALMTPPFAPPDELIEPEMRAASARIAANAVAAAIEQRRAPPPDDSELLLVPPEVPLPEYASAPAYSEILAAKFAFYRASDAGAGEGGAPEVRVDLVGGEPAGDAQADPVGA